MTLEKEREKERKSKVNKIFFFNWCKKKVWQTVRSLLAERREQEVGKKVKN